MPLSTRNTTSLSKRPSGRAHWLIAGTLLVISALWLGADNLAPASPVTTSTQGSIAQAKNQADEARAAAAIAIEELSVTAPRLHVPEFSFEAPAMELAIGEPEAPSRHWPSTDS